MTTALTEFADNGNSRTYTFGSHTASKPSTVVQRRKVPVGNQTVAESAVDVRLATEDANGDPLQEKVSISIICRYPIKGISADRATVLATARDILAGDEMANTYDTQEWLS
jgi:hypothetical protein